MEKEFVPYELALRMKQLGFDEPCLGHYQDRDETTLHGAVATSKNVYFSIGETNKGFIVKNSPISNCVLAPTYSQAFRWFREKHGYWSYIKEATKGTCRFYIEKFDEKFFNSDIIDSYEEAELACLEKLIKIVEQKEK
jgi:hypothetical protein